MLTLTISSFPFLLFFLFFDFFFSRVGGRDKGSMGAKLLELWCCIMYTHTDVNMSEGAQAITFHIFIVYQHFDICMKGP